MRAWIGLVFVVGCRQASLQEGTVWGTVAADGAPTPGALVVVGNGSDVVDAEGGFTVEGVAIGEQVLSVLLDGYAPYSEALTVAAGLGTPLDIVLVPLVVDENRAPLVSSLSVAPPQLLPSGTADVLATAIDPDGDDVTYTWTVDNGFTVAPGTTDGTAVLTAPGTEGTTATLTLEVSDPDGAIGTASIYVSTAEAASNRPPAISLVSLAPPQLRRGGTGAALASAVDPDGDELVWTWTATDGFQVSGTDDEASVLAPDASGATGTVTVTVTDALGLSASATLAVTTEADRPPVVASVSVSPPILAPGASAVATVTATDPEGDPVGVTWAATGGFTVTSTSATTATVTAPATFAAGGTVTATVSDGVHDVDATALVGTAASRAPVVTSLSASPATLAPLGTAAVLATGSDPDGGALTWTWTATGGFSVTGTGASVTLTAPGTPGTAGTVRATATDPQGDATSATIAVSTTANGGPAIEALSVTPSVLAPGGAAAALVAATDPDGDALTASWSATGGFTATSTGDLTADVTAPSTPSTAGTVVVVVNDGDHDTIAAVAVLTAANLAPVVTSASIAPPVLDPGGSADALALAVDPEGGDLTWTWTATGGFTVTPDADGAATVTAPGTTGTDGTVTVTATDPLGASASATLLVRTASATSNRAPVIGAFSAAPPVLAPNGSAAVLASATDPDGDPLTYAFSATGGFSVTPGTGGAATLTAPSGYGASGSVTVTVTDGTALATATLLVRTADRGNRAPIVQSLTASPPIVTKGGTITVTLSVTDPDGDPIGLSWTPPTNWAMTTSNFTATLIAPQTPGVNGTLTVTASDGLGGASTAAIVVSTWPNRAPVLTSLTVDPSFPLPLDDVALRAIASDPDGDTLSYAWTTSAGALVATGATATLATEAEPDTDHRVRVVATDAFGGTTAIEHVVVTGGCTDGLIEVDSACVPCGGDAALSLGPVAMWRLGEGGGALVDSAGQADATAGAATVKGTPTPAWDGNAGVSFVDSLTSYVTAPGVPLGGSAVAMSVWVRTADSGSGIVSYASFMSHEDFLLLNPAALEVWVRGASKVSTVSIADDAWHHVVAQWRASDGRVELWVDGVLRYTSPFAAGGTVTPGGTVVLGQEQDSVGGGFQLGQSLGGSVDDVALFTRFLSADDVQALFGGGVCEACDGVDNDQDGIADEWVMGMTAACAAPTCLELHRHTSRGTGTHWIDPTPEAGGAAQITCDMTFRGGGWAVFTESTNFAYQTWHEGDTAKPYIYLPSSSFVADYRDLSVEGFQDWSCRTVGVYQQPYQSNWIVWTDGSTSQFAQCQSPNNSSEHSASGTETTLHLLPAAEWHPEDCGDSSEACQHNVGDLWLR